MSDTHTPFATLADTPCTHLRLLQTPTLTVLQRFTLGDSVQSELDAPGLAALLRALPRARLLEALGVPPPPPTAANPAPPLTEEAIREWLDKWFSNRVDIRAPKTFDEFEVVGLLTDFTSQIGRG